MRTFTTASASVYALLTVLATPALAGQLNDTGMVRCAGADHVVSEACPGTGQDGESGRDVTHPADKNGHLGFVFQKICNSGEVAGDGRCDAAAQIGYGVDDWGCTRDNVTGLSWELRDINRTFLYRDAAGYVDALNAQDMCGHDDWRLPTLTELHSIVWFGNQTVAGDGAVDLQWFPSTTWYASSWSITYLGADIPDRHYVVWYSDGSNGAHFGAVQFAGIRAVRGPVLRARLHAAGDEVRDDADALAWRRCTAGQTWNGITCKGTATAYDWPGALAYAARESARTGIHWRVPNVKELASLVEPRGKPTIDHALFPNTVKAGSYWTSTPYVYDRGDSASSEAWTVSFGGGMASHRSQQEALLVFAVRLVRDLDQ